MKNIKFILFFLVGITMFSCTNNSEDIRPNSSIEISTDTPLFSQSESSEDELIEIGFFEGEEFIFTISEDVLSQVYSQSIEVNLEEGGVFESAQVLPSDEESEEYPYFILLSGSVGGEGSATVTSELIVLENDEDAALVRLSVRPRPVLPGICYEMNCTLCKKSDLTPTNLFCRCLSGGICPYYIDPTIVWTQ